VIDFLLELISLLDFVTDVIITSLLLKSSNTGWAACTVCAILAPPLVSSFQMMKFFRNKMINRNRQSQNCVIFVVSIISITWLFPFYLILMDIYFVFSAVFLYPIAYVLGGCGRFSFLTDAIQSSYSNIFKLSFVEMDGVSHMRTITQLLFESLIQFFIQVWMLNYYSDNEEEREAFGISIFQLLLSLVLTILHLLLELL